MAVRSGMFNSVRDGQGNGDRKYEASFFASYFSSFIGNGVFPNPSNGMQVMENENMSTVIKPGKGWINGYYIINDSDYVIQHDIADGTLKRIDRIIMRLNFLNREIEFSLLKGSYSSNPVAPALTRNTDHYELALADVTIERGALKISQSNITDTRLNGNLCGIVHGVVDQVDTTTLFNQYQSWLLQQQEVYENEFLEWSKDQRESFDTWLEAQKENIDTWMGEEKLEFTNWMSDEKAEFDAWYATIKDTLDGDIAANLFDMITTNEQTAQDHYNNDLMHGRFTMDGKRYQGQFIPNEDLTGLKFIYNEVTE